MNPNAELLTVKEVARQLRVDTSTVYSWIKRGAISAISLAQSNGSDRPAYRISKSVIDAVLASTHTNLRSK